MLFIHAGTHKTGSTAIQHHFAARREALAAVGILYPPPAGDAAAHHDFAWTFGGGALSEEERRAAAQGLRAFAGALGGGTGVVSSEEFEFLGAAGIAALHDAVQDTDTQVLFFLRRQDDLLLSEYKQNVSQFKTRYTGSLFEFYLEKNLHGRLNYAQLLSRWAKAFGEAAVKVAIYEEVVAGGTGAVAAMLGVIGAPAALMPEHETPAHQSLPDLAVAALRILNAEPATAEEHRRLVAFLRERTPPSRLQLLSGRLRRALVAAFAATNAEWARRFLARDGNPFPAVRDDGEAAPDDAAVAALVRAARAEIRPGGGLAALVRGWRGP